MPCALLIDKDIASMRVLLYPVPDGCFRKLMQLARLTIRQEFRDVGWMFENRFRQIAL